MCVYAIADTTGDLPQFRLACQKTMILSSSGFEKRRNENKTRAAGLKSGGVTAITPTDRPTDRGVIDILLQGAKKYAGNCHALNDGTRLGLVNQMCEFPQPPRI